MRKFMPVLTVPCLLAGLLGAFSPFAPMAFAADFPALPDGGSLIGDAGIDATGTIVVDLAVRGRGKWQAVLRCEGTNGTVQATRYLFCNNPSCAALSGVHQLLNQDITYDILVPSGYRYLSVAQDDGGFPTCKLQYAFPMTVKEAIQ